jgi:hypothetical protein
VFEGDTQASFSTVAGDPTSLEIVVNNAGVVSRIVLEGVLDGDDLVFNEATAEAAVGFDFFSVGEVDPAPANDTTFA